MQLAGGKRKFRIELEDAEGSKYNLSLEGNVSKEKITKIIEFMDLLNLESESPPLERLEQPRAAASVGDRIWAIVEKFPYGNFTSSDILELYEDSYNEPVKLSIISTYLFRYSEKGRLTRSRNGKEWVYRAARAAGSQLRAQPSREAAAVPDL